MSKINTLLKGTTQLYDDVIYICYKVQPNMLLLPFEGGRRNATIISRERESGEIE